MKISYLISGLLFSLLFFSIISCSGDKPIQGFDLTDINQRGKIDSVVINSIELEETFKDIVSPTGKSLFLSLGAVDNIETQILLRFNSIADTITVNSAAIVLHTRALVGDSVGSFTASVHQVLTDWQEDTVTVSTIDNMFDLNPVGSAEVFPTLSDTLNKDSLRIEINAQFVNSWKDTALAKQGILIDFSSPAFIKEFFSRENLLNHPQLEIIFNKSDTVTDTTSFSAVADAFLVRSVADPPEGPLYVANAIRHQSVIKFDLTNLSKEATINRADLELNVQQQNSLLKNEGISLELLRFTEPFIDKNSMRMDSTAVIRTTMSGSVSSFSIDIRFFVQEWISQRFENNGFIMRSQSPGLDVSRVAYFSSAIDSSLAPKIAIDFTLPPEGP